MEINNINDVSKQVNIEKNDGPIFFGKQSRYSKTFERLKNEVVNNIRYEEVLDEIKRYHTKKDGLGLVQKLKDANFSENEIKRASERKQLYWKKYEKNRFYESAQKMDSQLFGKIIIDFETYIEPLINKNESKENIMLAISTNIVNPILDLLNEEGAADEILNYNAEEIYAMIYFLTGKCHINWKNYDNI